MHFAFPLPWWLAILLVTFAGAAAFGQYRKPLASLTTAQKATLVVLRALTLLALVLFLFRPIAILPPLGPHDAVVPILVDVSRSMRIEDANGQSRIARATALLKTTLLPSLQAHFVTELYGVGEGLVPASLDRLSADARRTNLTAALTAVRDRYRGQRVAGIVLLSDGGETGGGDPRDIAKLQDSPPVFPIGVGSSLRDREVLNMVAGDPRLGQASVDLHVTAVSTGLGRQPFQLRLSANGKPLDTRRLVPPADGSPIEAVFTVSPDPLNPTVYTAEIPGDEMESVLENNTRSVLVNPAGRRRRILVLEGAPGFEHSFMTRAWASDPNLEVDVVTRKGRNGDGQDTFFVQAAGGRSMALTSGFPAKREQLYVYDGLVIANFEGEFFSRAQLAMAADFVSERGGGLLVMGGRSFAERGLSGSPLEEVLPVELNDRRGGVVRTSMQDTALADHNKVTLTAAGEAHPIMRLGSIDATRKGWAALPALAASAPVGGPRPGATVLAVTTAPGGAVYPVVAVQRYGQGRSMIFAGEASWRWKMLVPSTDRTYDTFWRQAARWLGADAPDPVMIDIPDAPEPGDALSVEILARDASFDPVGDAVIDATVTPPGGEATRLAVKPVPRGTPGAAGRFAAAIASDRPGLYRIRAEAKRGGVSLGSADRWMYVGGADREFSEPHLNEPLLRRMARASGGRYARAEEASRVATWLREAATQPAAPEQRDLWQEPWAFALVVGLLSAEWILRRTWGLR